MKTIRSELNVILLVLALLFTTYLKLTLDSKEIDSHHHITNFAH